MSAAATGGTTAGAKAAAVESTAATAKTSASWERRAIGVLRRVRSTSGRADREIVSADAPEGRSRSARRFGPGFGRGGPAIRAGRREFLEGAQPPRRPRPVDGVGRRAD